MTVCRTEGTWCPLLQRQKSSTSQEYWGHPTLTCGSGFPRWWEEEHSEALRTSLSYLIFKNVCFVQRCEAGLWFSRNATRFRVKSKQETVNSPGLMARRRGTKTGLPMNLQCKTSCHAPDLFLNIYVCSRGLHASFSSSDPQAGSCSAIIKDATDEFGKWKSHVCRYERPYMCKRLLNSKMNCFW